MIQAIDRAAHVMTALERARPLGITDLALELGLPRSTVHGIVKSLQAHGLVVQEAGSQQYALGPALLRLASVYLDTLDVRARALRWTGELARRTGYSVRLGTELFDEVLVVHHELRPDGTQQMPETGITIPAHASALGKVLLAYHPDRAERVIGSDLRPLTGETIIDPDILRAELHTVVTEAMGRERDEAVLGEACLAVPVASRTGDVVAAVGVVVPTTDLPLSEAILSDLREAGRNISRELGLSRWPPAVGSVGA